MEAAHSRNDLDRRATVPAHAGSQLPALSLRARVVAGGTSGNEQLTAVTGIVLLALLAVIGVTLLRLSSLLSVHLFVGMLLVGPIALKMGSASYRFIRYYTHDAEYRRKGAPPIVLRLIAPIVVASTIAVMISGVLLLLLGPSSRGALLPLHKVSFIVWGVFTGIHLLGHLPEVSRALRVGRPTASAIAHERAAEWSGAPGSGGKVDGRTGRILSLGGALTVGAVLAILLIPQFGPWIHASHFPHH
ncbi:MAG TPA: hypothetical protein VGG98_08385 [Solirubrobacteraceae bacterium]|jgi:hypothetical protein